MLPELSLWKCQRWNQPIQWCTNSSECFPSRRRLPNVTGAIVIALKTPKAANCAPSADGNVTRQQTLHHPMLYIKQFFIKSIHTQKANDTNQGKWRPREGRAKKKKIKTKKKKSDCRLKRRGNDWLLGLMFLSRHIVPAVQSQFISQTYWWGDLC